MSGLHPKHRHELNLRRSYGDGLRWQRDFGAGLRQALTAAGLPSWEPRLDPFWRTCPEAKTLAASAVTISSIDQTIVGLLRRLSPGYAQHQEREMRALLPGDWPADHREVLLRELTGEQKGLIDAGSPKEGAASDDKSPALKIIPLPGLHWI
jgi:hypothetical protein